MSGRADGRTGWHALATSGQWWRHLETSGSTADGASGCGPGSCSRSGPPRSSCMTRSPRARSMGPGVLTCPRIILPSCPAVIVVSTVMGALTSHMAACAHRRRIATLWSGPCSAPAPRSASPCRRPLVPHSPTRAPRVGGRRHRWDGARGCTDACARGLTAGPKEHGAGCVDDGPGDRHARRDRGGVGDPGGSAHRAAPRRRLRRLPRFPSHLGGGRRVRCRPLRIRRLVDPGVPERAGPLVLVQATPPRWWSGSPRSESRFASDAS